MVEILETLVLELEYWRRKPSFKIERIWGSLYFDPKMELIERHGYL